MVSILTDFPPSYFLLSKGEQEALIFRAMVERQIVDLDKPLFELSLQLGVPLSKVQSLVYRYRLSIHNSDADIQSIANRMALVDFDPKARKVVFALEDKFLRDLLIAMLKKQGLFADTSFNREFISLKYESVPLVVAKLSSVASEDILASVESLARKNKLSDSGALLAKMAVEYGPTIFDIAKALMAHQG